MFLLRRVDVLNKEDLGILTTILETPVSGLSQEKCKQFVRKLVLFVSEILSPENAALAIPAKFAHVITTDSLSPDRRNYMEPAKANDVDEVARILLSLCKSADRKLVILVEKEIDGEQLVAEIRDKKPLVPIFVAKG